MMVFGVATSSVLRKDILQAATGFGKATRMDKRVKRRQQEKRDDGFAFVDAGMGQWGRGMGVLNNGLRHGHR